IGECHEFGHRLSERSDHLMEVPSVGHQLLTELIDRVGRRERAAVDLPERVRAAHEADEVALAHPVAPATAWPCRRVDRRWCGDYVVSFGGAHGRSTRIVSPLTRCWA